MSPTLYIIGAGPGDPELISIKGAKALQRADVILYDALVSTELLAYAKGSCKLIHVGKRKGKKEFSQDEINQLLVFYAARHKVVVRLHLCNRDESSDFDSTVRSSKGSRNRSNHDFARSGAKQERLVYQSHGHTGAVDHLADGTRRDCVLPHLCAAGRSLYLSW